MAHYRSFSRPAKSGKEPESAVGQRLAGEGEKVKEKMESTLTRSRYRRIESEEKGRGGKKGAARRIIRSAFPPRDHPFMNTTGLSTPSRLARMARGRLRPTPATYTPINTCRCPISKAPTGAERREERQDIVSGSGGDITPAPPLARVGTRDDTCTDIDTV